MAQADTSERTVDQQLRCEIGKTLTGEQCQRLGEVRLDTNLLCVGHAELLKLEDRSNILLGTVLEMDKWLDIPHNRTDELYWRRVLHQRDEVIGELRSTRAQIVLIHSELSE